MPIMHYINNVCLQIFPETYLYCWGKFNRKSYAVYFYGFNYDAFVILMTSVDNTGNERPQ